MKVEEYLSDKIDDEICFGELPCCNKNSLTILYATDLHYDSERELCLGSLKKLREMTEYSRQNKVDMIILGGDTVDGHSEINKTLHDLSQITDTLKNAPVPVLICKGNHDSNSWYAYEKGLGCDGWLSDKQWFETVLNNFADKFTYDKENPYSNYCYIDFPDKKIRVIALNTSDLPEVTDSDGKQIREYCPQWNLGIREKQLKWLVDSLMFEEEGWSVILVSHNVVLPDAAPRGTVHNGQLAWDIIKAFKNRAKGMVQSCEENFEASVNYDFTENKSWDCNLYLYGHWHADRYGVYDGITCICSKDMMNAVVEADDGTVYCATLKDIPVICDEPVKNNPKARLEGGWDFVNADIENKTITTNRFRLSEKNRAFSL